MKNNGYYRLSKYTCDNRCEIGKPSSDCITRNVISKECGKYGLDDCDTILITFSNILEIINGFRKTNTV
jgi:hypothetical protein